MIEEIAYNENKYLIDVIGCVRNLGALKPTRNGSKCLDFHLMNERGHNIKATIWGSLAEELMNRLDDPSALYVILLPAMNVREYRGTIHLSSTSGTVIYDSLDIPEIKNLNQLLQ